MNKRRWRVIPRIHFINYRQAYPMASPKCWHRWLQVTCTWHGRIIELAVRHWAIKLDFRRDVAQDLIDAGSSK